MQFEGDPISLAHSIKESNVCVCASHKLDKKLWVCVAPSGRHAASWVSSFSDQRLFHREAGLLLEDKKAAGVWRTGSLMPNPPFKMEACAWSHAPGVMATWMIPRRQCWRELCICWVQP